MICGGEMFAVKKEEISDFSVVFNIHLQLYRFQRLSLQ